MTVQVINLVPHAIVVQGAEGDTVYPPSGEIARVKVFQLPAGKINGVTVVKTVFGEVEGLPEAQDGVVYITSTLVATVAKRPDVVSPDTGPTAVRDEGGRVIAVTRFQGFHGE